MSDLAVEDRPTLEPDIAQDAARGQVVYITDHGQRIAAIVPAGIAAQLERMTPDQLAELLEDFADGAAAREARRSIESGEAVISWEQVKDGDDL